MRMGEAFLEPQKHRNNETEVENPNLSSKNGDRVMKIDTSKAAKLWSINVLAMVFAVGLLAGQASAETIRLGPTNVNPQGGGAAPIFLDLSSAAGLQTTFAFSTSAVNSRVIITFNAECSITAPPTNWLNIDIFVDPAGAPLPFIVPPTNSDNALCSGNHTLTQNDGWVSAVAQATTFIGPAGIHTVRVRANGVGVVPNWRIDDITLIVETQP
jgi:hypothetical protein